MQLDDHSPLFVLSYRRSNNCNDFWVLEKAHFKKIFYLCSAFSVVRLFQSE